MMKSNGHLSVALAGLKELMDKKQLSEWHRKNLKSKCSVVYTYRIITGVVPPSLQMIMLLRNVIAPALWFYTTEEKLPDISFNRSKNFKWTNSRNFKRLKSISEIRRWCAENGIPYITIWTLLNGKRQLTFNRIAAWKHLLPPEDWFR